MRKCSTISPDEYVKLSIYQRGFFLTAPSAPPVNVHGHNTSSTSIWVDWDNVPLADQNGIILTYTVTYKALPNGSLKRAVVSAPTTQASLTGLTKYRNYSITVFASNAQGDGNISLPIIVITDEDGKLLIVSSCMVRS